MNLDQRFLFSNIEKALLILGNALLKDAKSAFVKKVSLQKISPSRYKKELIRVLFRVVFIRIASERAMISVSGCQWKNIN